MHDFFYTRQNSAQLKAVLLLALAAGSVSIHSESLPPFDSLIVAEGAPVHRFLLGEPFTQGVMRTAEQEKRDIKSEETSATLTPVQYKVPVFWGNSNFNTNERLVLRNSARLVKAIERLARLPPIAKSTRQWCQEAVDVVTQHRAQGEFYSPEHCRTHATFGLTIHAIPPILDAVFLSSVSPSKADSRVQLTLQYVCERCQPIGVQPNSPGTYLFQVEAVIDLKANKQLDALSLAFPLLLKD